MPNTAKLICLLPRKYLKLVNVKILRRRVNKRTSGFEQSREFNSNAPIDTIIESSERINTAGGLDVDTINLSSRDFNFIYYPTNGINSRGYKIRTNLFVRDEVSKNGKLTPDDLSYGETGEVITYEQDEFADRDYFIMTDYRFKVTDFKKMKIRVEAELPNWSEDNEYEY